jgi:phospholipid/cholesterol/gamma-HCH transport system substrate-binding protein
MTSEKPPDTPQTSARATGHRVITAIVAVGVATLAVFAGLKISLAPSFMLKTCFQNVAGLRKGAKVRLAGVDIGVVREVRPQPTDRTCLVAVAMEIDSPHDLKIPRDSVTSIDTAGVLGETYVEIDSSQASGAPIENRGVLPSRTNPQLSLQDWTSMIEKALKCRTQTAAEAAREPDTKQSLKSPTPPRQK